MNSINGINIGVGSAVLTQMPVNSIQHNFFPGDKPPVLFLNLEKCSVHFYVHCSVVFLIVLVIC